MMDDGKVTITIEIDAELLAQITEVLKPYGLTPEEAAVQFFEYCADPKTQGHAIELLKIWITGCKLSIPVSSWHRPASSAR